MPYYNYLTPELTAIGQRQYSVIIIFYTKKIRLNQFLIKPGFHGKNLPLVANAGSTRMKEIKRICSEIILFKFISIS